MGGQLLIATPDSANQNKHQFWMRDWFESLDKLGFKKHSYSKGPFHNFEIKGVEPSPKKSWNS